MKKINKLLTTALACGVLGAGVLVPSLSQGKEVKRVAAEDLEYSIEMTKDFFTNWVDGEGDNGCGSIVNVGATCWNGNSINALGSVFDGCLGHEGWTGTLNSRKWRQTTPWIYFEYGCANNNHVGEASDVKLVFKLWASKDAAEPSFTHDFHNDTFSQTTLILRNYEVPSAEYEALGGDFYMSVDLVDGRGNEYGANEFGYLHVNQTHQQVSDAQWYYYTHCVEGEAASVDVLRSHYYLNGSLRAGFVTGFAESFDTQESFNLNWLKDNYGNDVGERHQDRAISQSTYRSGSNMPFNSKNGFFKGWYGGANDDYEGHEFGYVASDDSVYRFVSKPFRLPDNGIVSVMMAGNSASLHLIDFDGGHGDLAWVDVKTFQTNGDENPIALTGKNVCTMVRHVINFSKYAGRLVQIGIADVNNKDGGWNAVYFDELKADYSKLPSLLVDVVEQDKDGKSYLALNDVYVKATEGNGGVDYALDDGPETDSSPLLNASAFVKSYMDLFRNNHDTNRFCSVDTSSDAKALLNAYDALTTDEQALVDASMDYHRVGATSENWWTVRPTFDLQTGSEESKTIGYSISYLKGVNVANDLESKSLFGLNGEIGTVNSTLFIVVIIATVISLSTLMILIVKKRRNHK